MKIIFVRHAEPDYDADGLTEKGWREARLLADRARSWRVDEFYSSPMGRARDTGKLICEAANRPPKILDWLEEFNFVVDDYENPDGKRLCRDFSPEYLSENPLLFDLDKWGDAEIMKSGSIRREHDRVCGEFDRLLERYGYTRNGLCYDSPKEHISTSEFMLYDGNTLENYKNDKSDGTTLVFFCHLGIMSLLIAHMINASPCTIWHGFFMPTSSVTVVASEERVPGKAYFRCQLVGCTAHLRAGNEPVSYYGSFAAPFMQ
ncbi:MAG: histidine phosphatase family protein [Butyrivibrio sp.]|nr:histidine phosphatase family protein [Butyrivibrio sp.]